jgi:hypothetical protein
MGTLLRPALDVGALRRRRQSHPSIGVSGANFWRRQMVLSMRMVLVAGTLMLVLLMAVISMVSADTLGWEPALAKGPLVQSQL